MNKYLFVVPAFNEEDNIEKVITGLKRIKNEHDVVVIDDGSIDKTGKIALELGACLISHPINLGAGASVQTGLKYALINNYRAAIVIDGDGQHDPAETAILLEAFHNSAADVMIGSRFLSGKRSNVPLLRKAGCKIFSAVIALLTKKKITDTTSGFRIYGRKAIKLLANDMPEDFPDSNMLLSLLLANMKICEVPISSNRRSFGRSMYASWRAYYYPFKIIINILAVLLRYISKEKAMSGAQLI